MSTNKRLISTGGAAENVLFDMLYNETADLNITADFVWQTNSSFYDEAQIYDIVRGTTTTQNYNYNGGRFRLDGSYTEFGSGPTSQFTSGTYSSTKAGWYLKGGGFPVTNTNGTRTSKVSANVDGGFSIVNYIGNGTSGITIGHGLSQAPEFIMLKCRNQSFGWAGYHVSLGNTKNLPISTSGAAAVNSSIWNNTTPTNTVFTVGNDGSVNTPLYGSFYDYAAYCFHSVSGISKIGSYTNASGSGNKVVTGFQPGWLLVRRIDSGYRWHIYDYKRGATTYTEQPGQGNAGQDTWYTDSNYEVNFDTDGFYFTNSNANISSGGTFIYMAFANENA